MIAGRRLSRGEGVHMPFVQVSVRQTEYTSKNEIQNEATLSYNNRISIFPVPSDATQSVIVCVCVYVSLFRAE